MLDSRSRICRRSSRSWSLSSHGSSPRTRTTSIFDQELRARTVNQASLIRAKLEGNINGNIQLVRGLVATLSTEPEMDQAALQRAGLQSASQGPPAAQHRRRARSRGHADLSARGQREAPSASTTARTRRSATRRCAPATPARWSSPGRSIWCRAAAASSAVSRSLRETRPDAAASGASSRPSSTSTGSMPTAACSIRHLPIEIAIIGQGRDGGCRRRSSSAPRPSLEDDPVIAEVILPSGLLADRRACPRAAGTPTPANRLVAARCSCSLRGALVVVPICHHRPADRGAAAAISGELGSREAELAAAVAPPRPGARTSRGRRLGIRHRRPASSSGTTG